MTEPDVNGRVEILHEDEALIVLNKPAPLPMHAGGRFYRNTLQHILNAAYHPQKPHPAHRLDANTTGVVLVTRTRHFAGKLQPQFARGEVEKLYLVRVQGQPPEDVFSCDAPISEESGELGSRDVDLESRPGGAHGISRGAKKSRRHGVAGSAAVDRTHESNPRASLASGFSRVRRFGLSARQKIGDTQTLAVGDSPLCLHAWQITFVHPLSKQPMEFTAPPPAWAV